MSEAVKSDRGLPKIGTQRSQLLPMNRRPERTVAAYRKRLIHMAAGGCIVFPVQ